MKSRTRNRYFGASVFVAGTLLLAACGGAEAPPPASSSTSTPSAPAPVAPEPGELVLAVSSEPPTLSPARVGHNEVNTVGMRNVYEGLVDRDPVTGDLIPLLATDWERLDDNRWRFNLRRGVSFHDGTAFDAEAAATVLEYLWNPDTPESIIGLYGGPPMTFEVVSEFTLDVVTEAPDPLVPLRMYFFHMFSPTAADGDAATNLAEKAVGTGPYRLVTWQRGQHLTIEANPDWWGIGDPDANGAVVYPSARFEFRPEASVRASMIEAGEAEFAMWLGPEDCARVEALANAGCLRSAAPNTIFVQFDAYTEDSMLRDIRVREAVTLAVDMELLVEEVLSGVAVRASQIQPAGLAGYNPDLSPYGYDPARARALLAEYVASGGTIKPVSLAFQQDRFPRVREFMQAMAAMLNEVGIETEVLELETALFLETFNTGTHPPNRIKVHTNGNNTGDFMSSLRGYFGRQFADGAPRGCWCEDQEMFDLITRVQSLDGQERIAGMQRIGAHVHENFYMDYGGHISLNYGVQNGLRWDVPIDHAFRLKHMSLN